MMHVGIPESGELDDLAYYHAAIQIYGSDDVRLSLEICRAEDGAAWVSAWVRVTHEEAAEWA